MKSFTTTKYFSNNKNYLFYTSQSPWDISSKYKNLIESLKLQYWLSKNNIRVKRNSVLEQYVNKAYYPFLKREDNFNIFTSGHSSIPHPDKIEKGGEDASHYSKK